MRCSKKISNPCPWQNSAYANHVISNKSRYLSKSFSCSSVKTNSMFSGELRRSSTSFKPSADNFKKSKWNAQSWSSGKTNISSICNRLYSTDYTKFVWGQHLIRREASSSTFLEIRSQISLKYLVIESVLNLNIKLAPLTPSTYSAYVASSSNIDSTRPLRHRARALFLQ